MVMLPPMLLGAGENLNATGDFDITEYLSNSTISGNSSFGGPNGFGGGLYCVGACTIAHSIVIRQ